MSKTKEKNREPCQKNTKFLQVWDTKKNSRDFNSRYLGLRKYNNINKSSVNTL